MNQIVSLFMFSCGDYEKVKQDVWGKNWLYKAFLPRCCCSALLRER